MITYREATYSDYEKIARLHTQSWQNTYRNVWDDEFLFIHALKNRMCFWEKQLKTKSKDKYVIVAEIGDNVCGFACAYANKDDTWGTLLDNLHVSPGLKGQGIGTELIKYVSRWSYKCDQNAGLYLLVLENNVEAKRFYRNLGAINYDLLSMENPGGGVADYCQFIWTDITKLMWRGKNMDAA